MKLARQARHLGGIALGLGVGFLRDMLCQDGLLLRFEIVRHHAHDRGFDRPPCRECLARFLGGGASHRCAAIGLDLHQPLEGKARKHLADARAADAEDLPHLVFAQSRSRRQFLAADRLVDARIDLIVQQRGRFGATICSRGDGLVPACLHESIQIKNSEPVTSLRAPTLPFPLPPACKYPRQPRFTIAYNLCFDCRQSDLPLSGPAQGYRRTGRLFQLSQSRRNGIAFA
jgi:hypothetical protein